MGGRAQTDRRTGYVWHRTPHLSSPSPALIRVESSSRVDITWAKPVQIITPPQTTLMSSQGAGSGVSTAVAGPALIVPAVLWRQLVQTPPPISGPHELPHWRHSSPDGSPAGQSTGRSHTGRSHTGEHTRGAHTGRSLIGRSHMGRVTHGAVTHGSVTHGEHTRGHTGTVEVRD